MSEHGAPPGTATTLTRSPDETRAVAIRLATTLRPGDLLLLRGPLGAGKTEFVRGLAEGLGIPSPVSSPTFTLMHLYQGERCALAHLDLYRLHDVDLYELGVDDLIDTAIVAIEWPERLASLDPPYIEVAIEPDDELRTITVRRFARASKEDKS